MEASTARRRRPLRLAAAAFGAALVLTGCGFDAQTLQSYTPAHGVNVEQGAVKVRNLLVVAGKDGAGVLSASILSSEDDRLTGVQATALKTDGSQDGPLTVSLSPVTLPARQLVVLTDGQQVTVSGPGLMPGGAVDVSLQFASGAVASATAPVVSSEHSIYSTITPSAPSPSVTPAADATPSTPPAEGGTPTPGATP